MVTLHIKCYRRRPLPMAEPSLCEWLGNPFRLQLIELLLAALIYSWLQTRAIRSSWTNKAPKVVLGIFPPSSGVFQSKFTFPEWATSFKYSCLFRRSSTSFQPHEILSSHYETYGTSYPYVLHQCLRSHPLNLRCVVVSTNRTLPNSGTFNRMVSVQR